MNRIEITETTDIGAAENPHYERYRPHRLEPRMSIFWWVKRPPYVLFILRELTSLFVGAYAVVLILQLRALAEGPAAWQSLMESFATPLSIVLHAILLLFLLFHSITWFRLAPVALVVKIGKRIIPGGVIVAVNFVIWILLSLVVAWLVLAA